MFIDETIILVLGDGNCIRSTPSLSTNSYTFMYTNKFVISTLESLQIQQKQIAARAALKRSETNSQLYNQS